MSASLQRFKSLVRNRRGQSLVEYGILVGGVALVCLAAVAIFGHKTNDLIAVCAAALPCAHEDDQGAIVSGQLVATEASPSGALRLAAVPGSMETNLGLGELDDLVVEAGDANTAPTP